MGSALFATGSAENKQHKSILRLWKILPVLNKPSQFQNRFLKKLSYSFLVNNKMPSKNHHLSKYILKSEKKPVKSLFHQRRKNSSKRGIFKKQQLAVASSLGGEDKLL